MPRAEPLQLKAAACQTFAGNIPGKPWRPIARTSNYYYYYPAHAQRMRRSVTDIYIYIYIYIIIYVRNHEPCAKALGNNYIYTRYTHQYVYASCLAPDIYWKNSTNNHVILKGVDVEMMKVIQLASEVHN